MRAKTAVALMLGILVLAGCSAEQVEQSPAEELSALLSPYDELLMPEGGGPFPAVVLFHGCGGKRANMHEWARIFRDGGFAALIVDSMTPRGLTMEDVCGAQALLPDERAGDLLVSLDRARRLPGVDPDRIVLAGWSHGAVSLIELLEMNPPERPPPGLEGSPGVSLEGLAGIVLVYPYCGLADPANVWSSLAPSLFLIGGADTIAPPQPCIELARALEQAGRDVESQVYPGVGHGFDNRAGESYDAEATADAAERLPRFLARIRER